MLNAKLLETTLFESVKSIGVPLIRKALAGNLESFLCVFHGKAIAVPELCIDGLVPPCFKCSESMIIDHHRENYEKIDRLMDTLKKAKKQMTENKIEHEYKQTSF